MIDPKTFYRELDAALANISIQKSDKNFYISILEELRQKFGVTLRFDGSYIYELRGPQFMCINASTGNIKSKIKTHFASDSKFAQAVIKHGSYIFNQENTFKLDASICRNECTPAAIFIYSAESQWIFIFELIDGWVREEITLFLNSVRTALNYRLMADKVQSEFERASQIQKSLLPPRPPEIQGYNIAQRSLAAELVGGDFYEYFQFDENHLGFAIGDASGHGIPAALLVRDVVIGLRMSLSRDVRIMHTLKKLNQVIQRSTYSTNFISLFIGEMEEPGHLFYVNAGHPPPFLISRNQITMLEASGIALGFLPEIELHRYFVYMEPGAKLVLYTDGIIERINRDEEQFGLERLQQVVSEHIDQDVKTLLETIIKKVYDFGGQTSWEDDASLVIIHRTQ
ncbi:serine/threonine-protein phosphatase [bacterium]|nr:serine/threonine-protein phosphatase [bacterium]